MFKKLMISTAAALIGIAVVAAPVVAQPWPPPPPGMGFPGPGPGPGPWGFPGPGPGPGPGWIGPGFGPPLFRPPPPPRPGYYCNYRVCAERYRSFDPRSCTYQPSYGPRRYCPM